MIIYNTHIDKKSGRKKEIRLLLHFLCLIVLYSFFISCIYDEGNIGGNGGKDKEQEVTISISLPNQNINTNTRALDSDDEERISSIELIVYDTSGNFDYITHGQDITDKGSSVRSFQVVLRTGNPEITILANCRELLQELYPDGIPAGTAKTDLEKEIKIVLAEKWLADTQTSGYRDMPMWGETGPVSITTSTTTLGNQPYELYRMLAAVNVNIALTDASQFALTSVRVYNVQMEGMVIPGSNLNIPNIPAGSQPVKGPLLYNGAAITTDGNGQTVCTGEIYLFETKRGEGKTTHPDHPCLVVGGIYKGKEQYYRIDFQSGMSYLDILRNHCYNVIITSVDDRGFNTPDEAYESFPTGIQATVIDWATGQAGDISIGGKYVLRVSTDQLVFNPDAGTQIMYIYTDHPDGWEFEEDNTQPAWITFTPNRGNPDEYTEVKVTVTAQADDSDPTRIYDIPVMVDNVEKTIRFAQLGQSDADLQIFATPTRIIFPKYVSQPVEIQVSTYPFDAPLYFEWSGDTFDWEDNLGIPADGTTTRTISLHPKTNTSGQVRSGILTIYIQDDYGHIASTRIEISQADRVDGFEAILSNPYDGMPGIYTFEAGSTVAWEVVDARPAGVWTPQFSGEQAAGTTTTYSFDLTGNPGTGKREIEVDIRLKKEPAEFITLLFEQNPVPPFLYSWPEMQQSITVRMPSVTGTANLQFRTNTTWQHNASDNTNVDKTFVRHNTSSQYISNTPYSPLTPFNPEIYTFEFESKEYTWDIANNTPVTPKGGSVVNNTFNIITSGLTPAQTIAVTLQREVPHMIRIPPYTTSSFSYKTSFPGYPVGHSSVYTYIYYNVDNNKFNFDTSNKIPSGGVGEFYFGLQTNTSYTASISTCSEEITFSPEKMSNSSVRFRENDNSNINKFLPENTTGQDRTVHIKVTPDYDPSNLIEVSFTQAGLNPEFTFEVETGIGQWTPLEDYLAPPNSKFPSGGLAMRATPTNTNGYEVFIFPLVNGSLVWGSYKRYNANTHESNNASAKTGMYTSENKSMRFVIMPHDGETATDNEIAITFCERQTTVTGKESSQVNFPRTPVTTFMQDHKSHTLMTTGRVIARRSLFFANAYQYGIGAFSYGANVWKTAAGVDKSAGNDDYKDVTLTDLTTYTPIVESTNLLSCAGYHEADQPEGTIWRLPTVEELKEMYERQFEIGGFRTSVIEYENNSHDYWAIDNLNGNASYVSFRDGTVGSAVKTQVKAIRCVRTVTGQ